MPDRQGTKYFVVVLDCKHTNMFHVAPSVRDVVYCARCRDYRIVELINAEFRLRCKSCKYSRGYGTAKYTAQRAADAHQRAYPTHEVHIMQASRVVEIRRTTVIENIFAAGVDSEPPF